MSQWAAVLAQVPVQVGRDEAARAARSELLKPEYLAERPSWVQRLLEWVFERVGEAMNAAGSGRTAVVTAIVVVLVAVVVIALVWRSGAMLPHRTGSTALFDGDTGTTAAQHRAQAQHYASNGQWDLAVRERLRAMARHIEQAGVLEPRPGRTAEEIATQAGRLFPAIGDDLRAAVRRFEDVWYGQRHATQQDYQRMCAHDERISAQRWRSQPTPVGAP